MASSRKKKRGAGRVVLILILCLALIAVIAVTVGYSLVARRVKALQAGAAFTFDYEAVSTADSPALYTILQKTGSTKGTVSGLYAPDALQLSITAPGASFPPTRSPACTSAAARHYTMWGSCTRTSAPPSPAATRWQAF